MMSFYHQSSYPIAGSAYAGSTTGSCYQSSVAVDARTKLGAPLKQMSPTGLSIPNAPVQHPGWFHPFQKDSPPMALEFALRNPQTMLDTADVVGNPIRKNQRYKTELCRPFLEQNYCRYGDKCQFAHGEADLRDIPRHPKYKTEKCKGFHEEGVCPYGKRCHFVHDENEMRANMLRKAQAQLHHFAAPINANSPAGQQLTIQPASYCRPAALSCGSNLGSAGESPVPSLTGSESPSSSSFSPGLSPTTEEDGSVFANIPPATHLHQRHHYIDLTVGQLSGNRPDPVDLLAVGVEAMFQAAPNAAAARRLPVFDNITRRC